MTKTAKTAETVEFPTFDAEKATDQLRAFAEQGVEQSKEAYAKLKDNSEAAQKALETTYESARAASTDISLKAISSLRANAEAGFSHLEALAGAKSFSDVVELQTAYFRKAVELAVEQSKDFQTSSTKAAEDVAKPMKDVFEKALSGLKAA